MALDTIPNTRGGRRPGAGAKPSTLEGLLKRSSPKRAARLQREIRRVAFETLIDWARQELRGLAKKPAALSEE